MKTVSQQFPVIEIHPNHVRVAHPNGYPVFCPYTLFPVGIAVGDKITVITEKADSAAPDPPPAPADPQPSGSWRDRPPLF